VAGTHQVLDTTNLENDTKMNKEAKESILHRIAKVHDLLEMWLGSNNLVLP
jgi:hypothetical protein